MPGLHLGEPEPPRALQAYQDYYELGPGRTFERLAADYRKVYDGRREGGLTDKEARAAVPTLRLTTLRQWASAYGWVNRAIAQQQKEADIALAEAAEERKKHKLARISEGRGLRQIGGQVVRRIIQRIQAGELDDMPLVGRMVYPEVGRPYRQDGLLDLLADARKAIEIGQLIERREVGEGDEEFLTLLERMLADLPPHEQALVRAAAFRAAREMEHP